MAEDKRYGMWFVVLVYAWTFTLILGIVRQLPGHPDPAALTNASTGCVDGVPPCELPRAESCSYYMALMRYVDDPAEPPSITPAEVGVRIIVDQNFNPLMGSSYPVPGGRLVWNVWTFHWYDGAHLGAIGRISDSRDCRWFEPRR